jgi:uncharacterized SAM-binding protein YcdF (DUF218 family)
MAASFRMRHFLWLLLPAAAGYTAVVYYLIVAHSVINEARTADTIVVFGAAEYDGRPSPVYKSRLDHASQLYHRGLAPIVITTGGAGDDPKFNEGGVGREYLKTLGIPDDQLIAETQSTYTAESARRVATIMRANSMRSCVAVSDGYHLFRIKHMMTREGIIVYGSPRINSRPPGFWKRQVSIFHEIASFTLWAIHLT